MNGSLVILALAMGLFIVSHLALPTAMLRHRLTRMLGERGYLAGYSLISIALLAWLINVYKATPYIEVLTPNTAMRHVSLTLMMLASFFLAGGFFSRNPSTVQGAKLGWKPQAKGIFKITRHPVMWGVAFWGVSHALANGHAAALIFFGGMAVVAIGGAMHLGSGLIN